MVDNLCVQLDTQKSCVEYNIYHPFCIYYGIKEKLETDSIFQLLYLPIKMLILLIVIAIITSIMLLLFNYLIIIWIPCCLFFVYDLVFPKCPKPGRLLSTDLNYFHPLSIYYGLKRRLLTSERYMFFLWCLFYFLIMNLFFIFFKNTIQYMIYYLKEKKKNKSQHKLITQINDPAEIGKKMVEIAQYNLEQKAKEKKDVYSNTNPSFVNKYFIFVLIFYFFAPRWYYFDINIDVNKNIRDPKNSDKNNIN